MSDVEEFSTEWIRRSPVVTERLILTPVPEPLKEDAAWQLAPLTPSQLILADVSAGEADADGLGDSDGTVEAADIAPEQFDEWIAGRAFFPALSLEPCGKPEAVVLLRESVDGGGAYHVVDLRSGAVATQMGREGVCFAWPGGVVVKESAGGHEWLWRFGQKSRVALGQSLDATLPSPDGRTAVVIDAEGVTAMDMTNGGAYLSQVPWSAFDIACSPDGGIQTKVLSWNGSHAILRVRLFEWDWEVERLNLPDHLASKPGRRLQDKRGRVERCVYDFDLELRPDRSGGGA